MCILESFFRSRWYDERTPIYYTLLYRNSFNITINYHITHTPSICWHLRYTSRPKNGYFDRTFLLDGIVLQYQNKHSLRCIAHIDIPYIICMMHLIYWMTSANPIFFYARHSEFRTTAVSLVKVWTRSPMERWQVFLFFTIYTPGTRKPPFSTLTDAPF